MFLLKAQQQQHSDDEQGVADVFGFICHQEVDQNQKQNGVCIKLRQSDIAAKEAFQSVQPFGAGRWYRLLCRDFRKNRLFRLDALCRRIFWRR